MSLRLYDGYIAPGDVDPIYRQPFNVPVMTGCGHLFDRDSLKKWAVSNLVCPICRTPISKEELENIKTRFEIFYDSVRSINARRFMIDAMVTAALFTIVLEHSNAFTYVYGTEGFARRANQFGQIFIYTICVITIEALQQDNAFTRRLSGLTVGDITDTLGQLYRNYRSREEPDPD